MSDHPAGGRICDRRATWAWRQCEALLVNTVGNRTIIPDAVLQVPEKFSYIFDTIYVTCAGEELRGSGPVKACVRDDGNTAPAHMMDEMRSGGVDKWKRREPSKEGNRQTMRRPRTATTWTNIV